MPLLHLSFFCPVKSICKFVSVHHQLIQVHEKPVRDLQGLKHHFIFRRFFGMALLSSSISWPLPLRPELSFYVFHQATPRLHLHITFVSSARSFFPFSGSCLTRKFHVESFYYPSLVKCKFSFILYTADHFFSIFLFFLKIFKLGEIGRKRRIARDQRLPS